MLVKLMMRMDTDAVELEHDVDKYLSIQAGRSVASLIISCDDLSQTFFNENGDKWTRGR